MPRGMRRVEQPVAPTGLGDQPPRLGQIGRPLEILLGHHGAVVGCVMDREHTAMQDDDRLGSRPLEAGDENMGEFGVGDRGGYPRGDDPVHRSAHDGNPSARHSRGLQPGDRLCDAASVGLDGAVVFPDLAEDDEAET